MAFCGAIDAVNVVNPLVVSDDTRHIQCMPPLVLQPSIAIRYAIGSTKNEFVLRKMISVRPFFAYRNDFIIGIRTTSNGMSDQTFNEISRIRFEYSNSIDMVQIAMKDILGEDTKRIIHCNL